MKELGQRSGMNRRDFIKTVALSAGMVILPPVKGNASYPLKIGVLYPRSTLFPHLAQSHLDGMKVHLREAGCDGVAQIVSLYPQECSPGPAAALRQSAALLEKGVDIVVGVVGSRFLPTLRDLFHDTQTLFIVNNIGANLVPASSPSPYIFPVSFNYWESNWAMGRWAARNLGAKAVIVSSFYDSGYDTLYAFRFGFEQAGGSIVKTMVTGAPALPACTISSVLKEIERIGPEFVYGIYCGESAVNFVKAYAESPIAGKIPLAGAGFMVDESILPAQGEAALGIKSCLSWSRNLRTKENRAFNAAYRQQTRRPADPFAVLGYDTARFILTALKAAGGHTDKTDTIAKVPGTMAPASPRGILRIQNDTQSAVSPLYIREIRRKGSQLQNEVISELETPPGLYTNLSAHLADHPSGWLDPYMAV